MKTKFHCLFIGLAVLAAVTQVAAQGRQFFRICGPAATTITALRRDGTIVWSNAQPVGTYTIQTVKSLPGGANWTDYLRISTTNAINTNLLVDFTPPAGMVQIPAGSFTMGDSLDGDISDAPTNTVTVSAFYMETNLVSYGQWLSVYNWAATNGYNFVHAGAGKATNHPVQTVDWYDAVKWCNARSQQAGRIPVYYTNAGLTQVFTNGETTNIFANWSASGFRLPTEAEWEKAARGGLVGQRFPSGNTITQSVANYYGDTETYPYDLGPDGYNPIGSIGGTTPATSPVGSFPVNGYGLKDMAGNVSQWCWDWYGTYAGGSDPRGPSSGTYRVSRSGGYSFPAPVSRCAHRIAYTPITVSDSYGFRCARGL